MINIHFLITVMLPAIIIAYVLGALPIAVLISRRAGVDIFDVGTGLAGASNVKRYVGKYRGLTVGVLDLVKGLASLIVGTFLGIDDAWIVLPALAAIMGHWNSVFTGFRGGDGLAILGGIMIGMFPEFGFGVIGVLVGVLVALGAQRLPYTSLLSVVLGYATVAALVANSNGDLRMALGLGGLSTLVLARAALGHLRRRDAGVDWNDLDDAVDQKGYL